MLDRQQISDYIESGDMTPDSVETISDLIERALKDESNKIEELQIALENLESDIEEWSAD